VEVELPHTEDFCHWEDGTLSHLKFMVELRANEAKGSSASTIFPIFTAMMNAMDYMEGRIDQLVDCCGSAGRQSCECGWSFEDIREYMILQGSFSFNSGVSPSIDADTNCVCFDDYHIVPHSHVSDSIEVISYVSVDSLKLDGDYQIAIADIVEIFQIMGEMFRDVYKTSFFSAITDQYLFCNSGSTDPALRSTADDYTLPNINQKMHEKDVSFWLHLNHDDGNARVSISGNGNSRWNWGMFYKLYNCRGHEDGFLACAFNELVFDGQTIFEKSDDLIVKGADDSSVKVVNDVLRFTIYTNLDFNGNHVVADLSDQAIGVQVQGGGSGSVGVAVDIGGLLCHILFLSGDYAGFWYPYAGFYGEAGGEYTSGYSLDGAKSVVYGYTKNENFNTPRDFGGSYVGTIGKLSGMFKIGFGVHAGYSYSYVSENSNDPNPEWHVYHAGFNASFGPKAGFTGGFKGEIGHLNLLVPEKPTSERSWYFIAANWLVTILLLR